MSRKERKKWNKKYSDREVKPGKKPHQTLKQGIHYLDVPFANQKALDLACGGARDGLFLAYQGLQVTALDVSLEALRIAKTRSENRGIRGRLQFVCADLDRFPLPGRRYSLISCFYYLNRALFPGIKNALQSGGVLVYKTYTKKSIEYGSDMNPDHLLEPGELKEQFSDFRILHSTEDSVGSNGEKQRHFACLIARKQ